MKERKKKLIYDYLRKKRMKEINVETEKNRDP